LVVKDYGGKVVIVRMYVCASVYIHTLVFTGIENYYARRYCLCGTLKLKRTEERTPGAA